MTCSIVYSRKNRGSKIHFDSANFSILETTHQIIPQMILHQPAMERAKTVIIVVTSPIATKKKKGMRINKRQMVAKKMTNLTQRKKMRKIKKIKTKRKRRKISKKLIFRKSPLKEKGKKSLQYK